MNESQRAVLPVFQEGLELGVKTEMTVQIEGPVSLSGTGHGDGGASAVISRIAVWDDDIEPIGSPAQKDHHELLLPGESFPEE